MPRGAAHPTGRSGRFFRCMPNRAKHPEKSLLHPARRIDALCFDPPIFQTNVFFGVKRGMIQNKARTWRQGFKRPVKPLKIHNSAKFLRREFLTLSGAQQFWS